MNNESIDILDLRGIKCPLNYVKAKLALNKLPKGSKLKIFIDLGEPVEMVPKSLKADGYEVSPVESVSDNSERQYELIVWV
ncbi:MAG: sulfurtransferase TusA family protein [Candidatus Caenarcaniphilales bacterium]|nr:sulfurtransferase TusA family protein [Candidatus Caenarcaniphilales bacterium]